MEDVMRSDIALHMRENAGVVQTQNNSAFNALNVESLLLSQYDNSKYGHFLVDQHGDDSDFIHVSVAVNTLYKVATPESAKTLTEDERCAKLIDLVRSRLVWKLDLGELL
jgi:hypothetical protein